MVKLALLLLLYRVRWLSRRYSIFSLHVLYLCFRFCLYNTFISPYHRLAGTSVSRAEMFNFVCDSLEMGTCAKAKISTSTTGNNTQNIIPSIWHSSYSGGWANKRWMPSIVARAKASGPLKSLLLVLLLPFERKWTIAHMEYLPRAVKHIFYSYMAKTIVYKSTLVGLFAVRSLFHEMSLCTPLAIGHFCSIFTTTTATAPTLMAIAEHRLLHRTKHISECCACILFISLAHTQCALHSHLHTNFLGLLLIPLRIHLVGCPFVSRKFCDRISRCYRCHSSSSSSSSCSPRICIRVRVCVYILE